jgi:hypothetical protein
MLGAFSYLEKALNNVFNLYENWNKSEIHQKEHFMNENKHLDFLTSLGLMGLALFVIFSGRMIYQEAKEPLYLSPALLPLILGCSLFFCSAVQLAGTLKNSKISNRFQEFGIWLGERRKDPAMPHIFGGILILGTYTFLLLPFLSFWLASSLFLLLLMLYLKATSCWKLLPIIGAVIGGIVLLFRVLFRVPLP